MTPALAHELVLPCGVVLPNRLLKAATSEAFATEHQLPTRSHAAIYARWSRGGVGLQVTGNVLVDGSCRIARGDVAIGDARALPAFRTWARSVAAPGSLFVQLNHPGRQSPRMLTREPVAPSSIAKKPAALFARARAQSSREIESLVSRFADAAVFVEAAGFAGVQLHAAHGYLAHQFLSTRTNHRDDAWGGSAEARRRFVVAIIQAIRVRVRPGFAVAVKLDASGVDEAPAREERLDLLAALQDEGVDLIELTGGTYEHEPALGRALGTKRPSRAAFEAYFAPFAEHARKRVKTPLALTGGFRTSAAMEDAIAGGFADVVGLARPLIIDPDLPRRLLAGERVRIASPTLRVGSAFIDAAAELFVHQDAMAALAEGRPQPPMSSRVHAAVTLARRWSG